MKKKIIITVLTIIPNLLHTKDISHFFRATPFFGEARFEQKGLTTFDIQCAYGTTKHARVNQRSTSYQPLWDIYGLSNMQQLGVGVPNKDLSNPLDLLLMQLELEPGRTVDTGCGIEEWATYSIDGRFRVIDAYASTVYNITKHFFLEVDLPIRAFFFNETNFNDISPTDSITPNNNTPVWQAFKLSFDAILKRYNLSRENNTQIGCGDLSVAAGYTYSYQETTVLDFVDLTFKIGILAPTGKKRNEDHIFSLAMGNNGHVGFQGSFDIGFGAYEWLTMGAHIDGVGFLDRTACVRIKTGPEQTGMVYLAKEKSDLQRGTILNGGVYLKADHVAKGLSATVGYCMTQQNSSSVVPCNSNFSPTVASSNHSLQGWRMHTIQTSIEYDFSKKESMKGFYLSFFYNAQVGGVRTFKTNMAGGECGFNGIWAF